MRRAHTGLTFFLAVISLHAQARQGGLGSIFSTRLSSTMAAADTSTISAAIYNNYSFVPTGAPNHVVPQGAIFAIKGSLGPANFSALQQTPVAGFGGVTINVTVNNTTVPALNYYVGPQLAGVLPSSTPVGDGFFTVTYNGQTSASVPIRVVQSGFGILTLDSSGQGTAKVCDYALDATCLTYPSLSKSASPGQVITLWGTGLGPTTNDAVSVDMTKNIFPAQVWIGGEPAVVLFAGRSQFVGLDLINVTIPSGVQGCYASVVVQIGGNVSNSTSLPIEPNGGPCSDPVTKLDGTALSALLAQPSFSVGDVGLSHATSSVLGQDTTIETASAGFYKINPGQLANAQQLLPQASYGSCTVWTFNTDQSGIPTGVSLPTPLDAGTVTVTSNGNTKTLIKSAAGSYSVNLGSGGFLTGTVGTAGTGGADVGQFSASMTVPSGFNWTNRSSVSAIDRTKGQLIQWSNAAPGSYVSVVGSSVGVDASSKPVALTTFTCIASGQDGQFTLPSWVLEAIPPSPAGIPGVLSVGNYATPVSFQATGLDRGFLNFSTSGSATVTYQ